jgi:hypothetical protein
MNRPVLGDQTIIDKAQNSTQAQRSKNSIESLKIMAQGNKTK